MSSGRALKMHLFNKHQVRDFEPEENEKLQKALDRKPKIKPVLPICLKCKAEISDIDLFNRHVLMCYGSELRPDIKFICHVKSKF